MKTHKKNAMWRIYAYAVFIVLDMACFVVLRYLWPTMRVSLTFFITVVGMGFVDVVILLGITRFFSARTKARLLQALAKETVRTSANLSQVSYTDAEGWARYDEALQALGFILQDEYLSSMVSAPTESSFSRFYTHAESSCVAMVTQPAPRAGKTTSPHCGFTQKLSADRWVSSSNERVPLMFMLCRAPRRLWISRPAMPPAELFTHHAALCTALCRDLGCQPLTVTQDELTQNQQRRKEEITAKIRQWGAQSLTKEIGYLREDPIQDWHGDYPILYHQGLS